MRLFTAILLLLFASQTTKAVEFKRQINRLESPVMVNDVLITNSGQFGELMWPKTLKGWVSAQQVEQWLSSLNPATENIKMDGFKRVWVEWCHPVNLSKALANAESHIRSLVAEQVDVIRVKTMQSDSAACFEQQSIQHEWLSFEKRKGTRFEGTIQFMFEQGKSIEKIFFFDVDARIDAITLKSKGRREQLLSELKVKPKTVVWSGEELTSLDALDSYQLKRNLPRNTVLKMKHVGLVEDIPKGQSVKVKVSYGAIEIDTTGTAMTAGSVGQRIKIRVHGSDEMSEGKVVKKGVVHVSV